jgi:xylulose-5-phosphate/fructose-6-phosphate phosphoketolase
MHQLVARTLHLVIGEIRAIQADACKNGFTWRPLWPMIVFSRPKCWMGPREVDSQKTEGYWRSHQLPMGDMSHPGKVQILETWMKSYKPEELPVAGMPLARRRWGARWAPPLRSGVVPCRTP